MELPRRAYHKTREVVDRSRHLLLPQPTIKKEITNNRSHGSVQVKEEIINKGNLLNRYKCQLMKFNRTWNDVQQKQDLIKATYTSLKKLHTMIIAEQLPIPRPMPCFRIIEYDSKVNQNDAVEQKPSDNVGCCNHNNLLNDMERLIKEKEDLTNYLMKLKNQITEMENQHKKELEEKEAKLLEIQEQNMKRRPILNENEYIEDKLKKIMENKNLLNNERLSHGDQMVKDYDCHIMLETTNNETENLKMKVEQSDSRCNFIEEELNATQIGNHCLEVEKNTTNQSLEIKESQTQVELCEITKLYEKFGELNIEDDKNGVQNEQEIYLQKMTDENRELCLQISRLQHQLQDMKHEKELLQECLKETQKREYDLNNMVKQLKKNRLVKLEHKDIQVAQDLELKKKLILLVNVLNIDDNKKQLLLKPLNQDCIQDTLVHHMKLFYNEFNAVNNCNKEQADNLKVLELQCLDLKKEKENLETRVDKVSAICRAYQGLIDSQENQVLYVKELKSKLDEEKEKCENLNNRLVDMEKVIAKTKERENLYKKKYFKERHANRKKHKKKCENWLSKIFDWRQVSQT